MINELNTLKSVIILQQFELGEMFGFETRNKYSINTEDGKQIGFAAEQQKGLLGFLSRQFFGHWRRFDVLFFDTNRHEVMVGHHPFRWLFQRMEVSDANGKHLGAIQSKFSILRKAFDIESQTGQVLMSVQSPIWKLWTFPFIKRGREVARIEKKWSGVITEVFTDKDKFRLTFLFEKLSPTERQLLLAASIFVDLQYFEVKSKNS